jgi:hypothetical protein
MASSIRGHMGQFKIFENGALSKIVDITKVSVAQDSSFMRTNYVGRAIPEGDQSIEGWTGSADLEVKDPSVDDFIDGLVTNNLNGVGVSDYTFISTENYADGSSRSYVYVDVQWKMSKDNGGLNEKITKKLDFQCSSRLAL